MLLMGDEVRRTQQGNNNGYCHDDESAWFDWTNLQKHADVHRFVQLLASRRLMRDATAERRRLTLAQLISGAYNEWHGVKLNEPDWGDDSHSIAFCAHLNNPPRLAYFIFNAYWEPLDFELPRLANGDKNPWHRWVDTSLASPEDVIDWQTLPPVQGHTYRAGPRSVVALTAITGESPIP
jgi:isoamylase